MDNQNISLPYKLEKFTARNDYAFKKLFGTYENKDIMIEFISLVTKINKTDFRDVQIENSEMHPKFFDDKVGRLDIKILLKDGRKIDVEMQNIYFDYYAKRSIFYWTELLTENFKHGADYSELNKCIAINILNQPFKLTNKLHSVYKILEWEYHTLLDDIFEIHFFDLTKLNNPDMTELEKWLLFIKTEDSSVRTQLAQGNPVMVKANEVMNNFYLDDKERERYMAAGRYESDRISMIHESERRGLEQGIQRGLEQGIQRGLEQGIQRGLEQGIQRGKQEGLKEGLHKKAIETAKNLLNIGLSIDKIAKATGLTIEEVQSFPPASL